MITKRYVIQRLYNNMASIRTTTVDMCVRSNANLQVVYGDDKMTIPLEKLKDPHKFQIHKNTFKSKYNPNQTYELYDFPFISDNASSVMLNQSGAKEVFFIYTTYKDQLEKFLKSFVPEFGNKKHIDVADEVKKVRDLLKKIEGKENYTHAKKIEAQIKDRFKQIEFLTK